MRSYKLSLNSVEKVKTFFNSIAKMKGNFDIEQGHKYIDAKSLMGLFTLDLKRPVVLQIHDDEQYKVVVDSFKDFAAWF